MPYSQRWRPGFELTSSPIVLLLTICLTIQSTLAFFESIPKPSIGNDIHNNDTWFTRIFNDRGLLNLTFVEDDALFVWSKALKVEYTIEQTETWGGFVDFGWILDEGTFDCVGATHLSIWYKLLEAQSAVGRAHFRLIMLDDSDCNLGKSCIERPGNNLEQYYSFYNVLDGQKGMDDWTELRVELKGDDNSESPLHRTGWAGQVGNNKLDKGSLKGWRIELSIDSQGEMNSTSSGVILLDRFSCPGGGSMLAANTTLDGSENNTSDDSSPVVDDDEDGGYVANGDVKCVVEPDLRLAVDSFKKIEFLAKSCCEECVSSLDCLYGYTVDNHCYLASRLETANIQLITTEFDQKETKMFWKNDVSARGDFCDKCECREYDRSIDCRGRDLLIVPQTFTRPFDTNSVFRSKWTPRKLDLRENPSLVMLGLDSLGVFNESLEELRLPENMRYISKHALKNFRNLDIVTFENDETPENVITKPSGFFGDVCCGLGLRVNTSEPSEGLTFCDMQVFKPGIDAVFEPFWQYVEADTLDELKSSSGFMAEAAESPEKCAEYCAINSDCKYFSYDARKSESEHRCYLNRDVGKEFKKVCCEAHHYADSKKTIPGWTSGRPPRTRCKLDNAVVLLAPQNLVANEANDYTTEFQISLGSKPLRGAVWIEPTLETSITNLNVTFSPPRVALYDTTRTATIQVTIPNVQSLTDGDTEALVVTNIIQSCDTAFTTDQTKNIVYIEVITARSKIPLYIIVPSIVVPFLGVVLIALMYVEKKKREADAIWSVKTSELYFYDPPEVIGQGTFGLVVLAEYRGTQVAVKRVIPKFSSQHDSEVFDSLEGEDDVFLDDPEGMDSVEHNLGVITGVHDDNGTDSTMRTCSTTSTVPPKMKYWKMRAKFIAEMRQLSKLRHPCITTVMGAVISKKEEPMLVMEYMELGSLYDLLHNQMIPLDGEFLLPILRDIAQGIRFLHAATPKVVHGDLKAQNILVDSKFRAKVSDFGLSQKKQMGVTGTPFWMAPELLRNESENTAASDAYSFGVVLYEVYARQDPYKGEKYDEVLNGIIDPQVNKRPSMPESCPLAVKTLMTNCLTNDPSKRPTFDKLDTVLRQLDVATVEPLEKKLRRRVSQTTNLLADIFPTHIAEALRDGRKVEPDHREIVTLFFSDIVGFTNISSTLSPIKVSDMLDRLYKKFDELSRHHDVFKVETIGDAYVAVTNLVKDQPDHAVRIAHFSVDAVKAANETMVDIDDPKKGFVNIRVGFHSGPIVANVVGSRNPRYCLFGDTVNTASRMESNSESNRIQSSQRAAEELRDQFCDLPISPRGTINVKGKGQMRTFWINESNSSQSLGSILSKSTVKRRRSLVLSGDSISAIMSPKGRSTPKRRSSAIILRENSKNKVSKSPRRRSSAVNIREQSISSMLSTRRFSAVTFQKTDEPLAP